MGNNMKIATKHRPRKLVSIVKEKGDESFCSHFDTSIEDNFKLLPDVESHGYKISHDSRERPAPTFKNFLKKLFTFPRVVI